MAELLVMTMNHGMDKLTQEQVDKMTPEQKRQYESRSQYGDVIVVRPDGHKWGTKECPPDYVVVKIPEMSYEEARKYEESLHEEVTGKDGQIEKLLLRVRKHKFLKADVESAQLGSESMSLSKTQAIAKVAVKSGLSTEISAPVKSVK
jgi:hypothetical protein